MVSLLKFCLNLSLTEHSAFGSLIYNNKIKFSGVRFSEGVVTKHLDQIDILKLTIISPLLPISHLILADQTELSSLRTRKDTVFNWGMKVL